MTPSEQIKQLVEEHEGHPHVVLLQTAVGKILDEMREQLDELQMWRNSVKDQLL